MAVQWERGAPLVVAAMPSELRHALESANSKERRSIGPWTLWTVSLDGRTANLLLSGIGMVNAGAAFARALAECEPSVVVNYGCAGAHRPEIRPGEVVIGDRYVHHRAVTILPTGVERHSGVPVDPDDITAFHDYFDADTRLLDLAKEAIEGWSPSVWPDSPHLEPRIFFGPVASADAWTQETGMIERINDEHGTLCEDMEAAALAQIAFMHGLPFLAVKDISNNEFDAATIHGEVGPTLAAVEQEVGRRAFEVIRRLLANLPGTL
jgi:adenosylhomocysteine nucleosidase